MAARKSARSSTRSSSGKYTRPALRERLKKKIQAGDKGGRPGQWSARKSQLLAQEYKKAGGGYAGGKGEAQKSLDSWTKEDWRTSKGGTRARQGRTTSRYLPKKAWDSLSESEKRATEKKKRSASRRGKQFVANTPAAKVARKKATSKRSGTQRTSSKTSALGRARTSRSSSASRSRGKSR
ncbi:hypothetical protein D187_008762 [Cystobacter fuscus DSM 2262]|uniref:DUF5872 domain-containing protein n=1 Tax=Cystobacter fuscus (strain ATCC 25194 / DSM 2262 / NBRC 100088 / M29) TaxID=1242864 RepID=S9QMU6_CYSF2|nr:hypothetical protein [Cystobacter fuscus]EPX62574.1 hypothetical protein D187_008762 [Cystobacter fuscus DSM 2262]